MSKKLSLLIAVLAAFALVAAACGDDSDDSEASGGGEASCDTADLPLKTDGTLTVATGEPAFEPWMVDDDPANGEGYESAVVYAVADNLGLEEGDVEWVRTGFDEAVAPGPKDFDFNIQQYSITPDRDEVVDFSTGYYEVEQALVALEGSSVIGAESIADLEDAKLGAAIGTTSLDYIEEVIQPSTEAAVYNDNAGAKAAIEAGQIDGLVFDLPTAYFITAVEIEDASIVGVLPRTGADPEELGMLFEDGSALTDCVNQALADLTDSGDLAALEEEWLSQGGDIPEITE
jgi:polar amino acid transport system substrate-binding protein